ncbi:MAG: hypothetical protein AUJ92_08215 [Armatimonadetes bacterium CG2_30_59_28]|nr:MAG: hypothetical protein AUJ92_08215 [Armatimonadetes bacterium CG2_30_59_28]PIU67187.1 MAG: protein yceI precursor [Armatimonadetes bacterium CG07_land_8_20_14_0_80_59_28]PIX43960.1 MAG: protein yceI precursor [Armatimonadetes bacterium CG_4_8_14_3_um_filter_58_9]PIY43421.1 MAG: protein yceI precursor [Armatimonadetes bacterium CG_4_10_14_3_um_filter_59_10]
MRSARAVLITLLLIAAPRVHAETYQLDPVHSHISFKIQHLVGWVVGDFTKYEGTIKLDENQPEKSKVEVTIQTDSLDTRNDMRDKHLKSPDFFDVAKYPNMTFKSTAVTLKGKKRFYAQGDFTLHGITKSVILKSLFNGKLDKDPWGNRRTAFSATTTLNRKDFGITWNKQLDTGGWMVGDKVYITIDVEAAAQ